jgi:hypothetical protein
MKKELNWVYLFDYLSDEGSIASHIRVVDTLIFDPINSLRPLFWVYTSETGQICKYNLRDWTVPEIIDNVLNVYNKHKHATLIHIPLNGLRVTIESPTANNIVLHNLQAIQLYTHRYKLDSRIFFHYFAVDKEEKVYFIENAKENLVEIMNPIHFRIKAASRLMIHRLKQLNCYSLVSIKMLYNVDQCSDPWLIGFSDCFFEHILGPSKSISLIKESPAGSISVKNFNLRRGNRELIKGTPMIRGTNLRIKSMINSKNLSFSGISIKEELSKTIIPALGEQEHSLPVVDSLYNIPCRGQFCNFEMPRLTKFDKNLRCLIPFYLLEKGQKSDYSPFINPALRKLPTISHHSISSSQLFKKLHYTKQVPVCLKCFIIYYNIKEKNKQF